MTKTKICKQTCEKIVNSYYERVEIFPPLAETWRRVIGRASVMSKVTEGKSKSYRRVTIKVWEGVYTEHEYPRSQNGVYTLESTAFEI